MTASWFSLPPQFIQPIINILTAILSISFAFWQFRKTQRHNLTLHQEKVRDEYRRTIHSEIESAISSCREKTAKFSSSLHSILMSLTACRPIIEAGLPLQNTKIISYQSLNKKMWSFHASVLDVMAVIEKYQIVEPRLYLFNLALGLRLDDLRSVFNIVMNDMRYVLPNESDKKNPVPFQMPSVEFENHIQVNMDCCHDMIADIQCYVGDLRTEIQNLFLGTLFEKTLQIRKPLDVQFKVLTTQSPAYELILQSLQEEEKRKKERDKEILRSD